MSHQIAIVGAGLCGNLLAILLADIGLRVSVFERDTESTQASSGRSINLALAARGIRALQQADAFANVQPLLLPMRGRIVHERDESTRLLRYGQFDNECIWSVSRYELNRKLIEIARERFSVTYNFGHECVSVDPERLTAGFRTGGTTTRIEPDLLIAADGAGSVVRRELVTEGSMTATETLLDHGYRELTIPPLANGDFALAPEGLHIWPRGGFMLIALPNPDCSFTATLFLPLRGRTSFADLTADNVEAFFAAEFSDAVGLINDLTADFAAHPIGTLGTVHCDPWRRPVSDGGNRAILLIGDAAHAIVPFHGQGMNAGFEDCAVFADLVATHGPDWPLVTRLFEEARRDNARAIAEMALENYQEMRDGVRSAEFERQAALSFELERRFSGKFIPRYSMVMFHPEIGYAEAQQRGRVQAKILNQAMAANDDEASLAVASRLIMERM
jgi:kynurenine 3-monooxygenase